MMTMLSHLVHTNSVIVMNATCDFFENCTIYSHIEWLHLVIKIEMLTTRPKIMTSPSECKVPNMTHFNKQSCIIWLLLVIIWLIVVVNEQMYLSYDYT
jgi:hypothetical protein